MKSNVIISQRYCCVYDFARIPKEIRAFNRFVIWRLGPMKPNGKRPKIPLHPKSLRADNPLNSGNWLTFEQAVQAYGGVDVMA